MKRIPGINSGILLVAIVLSFMLGAIFHVLYEKPVTPESIQKSTEKLIQKRQSQLEASVFYLQNKIEKEGIQSLWYDSKPTEYYFDRHIHLFITSPDSILYWNSNLISGSELLKTAVDFKSVRRFNNAWCIEKTITHKDYHIRAFYAIKYVYRINNDLIQSHFTELQLPNTTRVNTKPGEDVITINDNNGNFLFGLSLRQRLTGNRLSKVLAILFINLGILFVILWFFVKMASTLKRKERSAYIAALAAILLVVVLLAQWFYFPSIIKDMELFSPMVFAIPNLFRSLGVLLYTSIFWLIVAFAIFRYGNYNNENKSERIKYAFWILQFIVFIAFSCLFLLVIEHSVINFNIYQLQETNGFSFLVYLIFFMLFGGWILILSWGARRFKLSNDAKLYRLLIFIVIAVSALALIFKSYFLIFTIVTAFILIILTLRLLKRKQNLNFLHFFFFTLVLSNLLALFAWTYGLEKEYEKQKTTLVNMSEGWFSERDRSSELLLNRMWTRMKHDKQLQWYVSNIEPNPDKIRTYLMNKYFTGYWRKYDVQVVICWPGADLYFNEETQPTSCYQYFDSIIVKQCEQIEETGFYYQNNKNGRISYFGKVLFSEGEPSEVSLFLDIESNPISKGVGYPELLVDQASNNVMSYSFNYDFGRYSGGKLVTYTGDYRFNVTSEWIPDFDEEFYRFTKDDYCHLVYKLDQDNYIVLSRRVRPWYDYLLLLTYIYLYMFGAVSLAITIYMLAYRNTLFSKTMAGRIRFVMVGTLLFAFMLVAIASIVFNVRQVREKQYNDITDKSRSVLMFLDQFIGDAKSLKDVEPDYLEDLLQNLSNGLYLDVNLYSFDGQLVSSSRPLIYDYNIIGRRMATEAFNVMHYRNTSMEIIEEGLGNFKYLSSYLMIYNWENELLGYVNVPFFISKDELRAETYTFIVVIINIYLVFVLMALFVSIILIRNITRPLRMIQDMLSGLKVTGTNEIIEYEEDDEIGDLVKEYNRMAAELTRSAAQLASNQRKLAWREMARQIAHEIKNPLTPMKLNLQQLQRAKAEQHVDFDKIFRRTAETIIEQIDNLSRIASSFSDFAQMPEANPDQVDLYKRLSGVVQLFTQSSDVKFEFETNGLKKLMIFADGEQLVQVFNNLIKNAIQAIPANRDGLIRVELGIKENDAMVTIKDNGLGIAPEAQGKLFQPSFTTKSSGMGLGLAISKNILVTVGGDIWFETEPGKGTTFFVKLPLLNE